MGTPALLVDELVRGGNSGLTLIWQRHGAPGLGVGKLISAGLVR